MLTDARSYFTQLQLKRARLANKYYRLTGQSLSKEYIETN